MDIGAIPHQTFPSVGYAISAARDGRVSLPVAPGMLIYSHLKHVSGTPAPEGTSGVTISKLKILDTLIDQLEKMKTQSAKDFGEIDETDEKRINYLIEQYQSQIRAAQNAVIYTPAAPAPGALFDIAA